MNIFSILKDLYYKSSSARFIDYLKMGGDCLKTHSSQNVS